MSASAQARRGDPLTKKLRDFSVKYVKITNEDMARSRSLVQEVIEKQIMSYCERNSLIPILRREYTGSVYEGLKTEKADEVDVMVVLKITRQEVTVEACRGIPGYARLEAQESSILRRYSSAEGYIIPERLRNGWFHSLVVQAVNAFHRSSCSDFRLEVRYHGPATQIDITRKRTNEMLLSVDLVPCFHIGAEEYFVAKPYTGMTHTSHPELFRRRSFSLKEKGKLQHMDTDGGCRHELLRIVKTIVKRERTSLAALQSYHLKNAFMRYMRDSYGWNAQNSLGEKFLSFLRELQTHLERRNLPHFWLPGVNLLEGINPSVVEQMANRLKRILNSQTEQEKILV